MVLLIIINVILALIVVGLIASIVYDRKSAKVATAPTLMAKVENANHDDCGVDCPFSTVGYTKEQLVSFGNYLLSAERKEMVQEEYSDGVHDSDVSNWECRHSC